MLRRRLGLRLFVVLYGLATVVAQWPHDHRAHPKPELTPLAGCEDPRPHIAAHQDFEPDGSTIDCPVCSHRSLVAAWERTALPVELDRCGPLELPAAPALPFDLAGPRRARAPPRI